MCKGKNDSKENGEHLEMFDEEYEEVTSALETSDNTKFKYH